MELNITVKSIMGHLMSQYVGLNIDNCLSLIGINLEQNNIINPSLWCHAVMSYVSCIMGQNQHGCRGQHTALTKLHCAHGPGGVASCLTLKMFCCADRISTEVLFVLNLHVFYIPVDQDVCWDNRESAWCEAAASSSLRPCYHANKSTRSHCDDIIIDHMFNQHP